MSSSQISGRKERRRLWSFGNRRRDNLEDLKEGNDLLRLGKRREAGKKVSEEAVGGCCQGLHE